MPPASRYTRRMSSSTISTTSTSTSSSSLTTSNCSTPSTTPPYSRCSSPGAPADRKTLSSETASKPRLSAEQRYTVSGGAKCPNVSHEQLQFASGLPAQAVRNTDPQLRNTLSQMHASKQCLEQGIARGHSRVGQHLSVTGSRLKDVCHRVKPEIDWEGWALAGTFAIAYCATGGSRGSKAASALYKHLEKRRERNP